MLVCCMRCSCLHRVQERSFHIPRLPCRRPAGTRNSGAPHHPCMTRFRHFSFCTGISMSYRNRYLAVASFSDLLPWHPFCSAMVTKCFITCLCQHFHKNCIKLAYVIRIMITTIKMFKIVVCFKLLNNMGIFRNCCLLFPASFKLA